MISKTLTYDRFKFGQVIDDDILKDTFRMRYEVYVDEFGFENKHDHPDGLEKDEYEKESIHFACLNETDSVVGTIRLVLNSDKGFPIEHATKLNFTGEKPEPNKTGEISRLTVTKDLRRRKEDGMYGVESYLKKKEGGVLPDDGTIPKEMEGRKNPIIVLGLYQVMLHESLRQGLTHWYMITEKKIFYALKKYGFLFQQIGVPVQYHGERIPYFANIHELLVDLKQTDAGMYDLMLAGLEDEYWPNI
ncbi:PEP-CTERM/exosortase system-associated acyltransferase [Desulfobacter hydrogenophilus]|uniref:PEP-CTERM/exosortase system-associated acyltransferase n=1 Tax=Desulfobacter hydrogenophilus TaxID=2291 RepID=A0A328FB58_9BACT|nr:PEP-CTERM/exosortase system-associated acyltransferase [Desulfobacter hydrogenophilus]NDY73826.1 PEP-CTERM/exosortase system-associated acyltransferase [Desulfobacter hydrogenophilus]QBH13694.1 PEP-CTERM/exosortase system-associated acyltransferase [Desulfobacter hydrogenophilus]RAM01881.1 PEP-CTERM/exosortase system-associated acyltransferase [Desulfobacter hydrogenophilus]